MSDLPSTIRVALHGSTVIDVSPQHRESWSVTCPLCENAEQSLSEQEAVETIILLRRRLRELRGKK